MHLHLFRSHSVGSSRTETKKLALRSTTLTKPPVKPTRPRRRSSRPEPGSLVLMAAAATRFLLPRAARTAASPSAAALLCGPLDSFSGRRRALAPPSAVFSRNLSDTAFDAQALDTRVPATVITGFLGSGKVTPPLPLPLALPPFLAGIASWRQRWYSRIGTCSLYSVIAARLLVLGQRLV
jgi:hypothetical protein